MLLSKTYGSFRFILRFVAYMINIEKDRFVAYTINIEKDRKGRSCTPRLRFLTAVSLFVDAQRVHAHFAFFFNEYH